jgi:nucleotide-binding universal stress UspA family protein
VHEEIDAGAEENAMTSYLRRILLATDGSEEAEEAAGVAVELARSTGSELHVVHVELLPPMPPYPEVLGWREDLEWAERQARELLDEQVKKVEDAGGTVAGVHLRGEFPAEEIVALAEELGTDLIVVGSRGRGGIRRALKGSVSDRVVRHAHCPVLVVRSPSSAATAVNGRLDHCRPVRPVLRPPRRREEPSKTSRSGKHGQEFEK